MFMFTRSMLCNVRKLLIDGSECDETTGIPVSHMPVQITLICSFVKQES